MSSEEEQNLEDAAFQDEEIKASMQILTALGFTPHYHDKDKAGNDETNFGIRVMNTKIGVKFNAVNPTGLVWAYILAEDGKKDFIKNGDLKQLPLVRRYLDIQAGEKPMPEPTVTGRIVEKRSKSVVVEIKEDGVKKEIIFGWGAVKKHDDGHHYIPYGFSKPSTDNPDGKMDVPRNILLPELDPPPATESREETEARRIRDEQGREATTPVAAAETAAGEAELALHVFEQLISGKGAPAANPTVKENLTVPGLIEKYLSIAVQVTKAVKENGGVSALEIGYVTNWVCNKVVDELMNSKGGSGEE